MSNIQSLIDAGKNGNLAEFTKAFNSNMSTFISKAIRDTRDEIASSVRIDGEYDIDQKDENDE